MAFHRLKTAAVALLTGVLIAFSAATQQVSAQAATTEAAMAQSVVQQFHATLINVMKEASNLGYDGRFKWLAPVVRDTFNLPFMAEVAAGLYWSKATEAQRQAYVNAFAKMSTATYASRFDGYSGEQFDILGSEAEGRNSIIVRTNLVETNGNHTNLNYLLRNIGGAWKVVDIYLNGSISELATRKSDFSDILKSGGIVALTKALDDKVASIAKDEARAAARSGAR